MCLHHYLILFLLEIIQKIPQHQPQEHDLNQLPVGNHYGVVVVSIEFITLFDHTSFDHHIIPSSSYIITPGYIELCAPKLPQYHRYVPRTCQALLHAAIKRAVSNCFIHVHAHNTTLSSK